MREIFFTLLLLCSAAVFANPTLENEAMERPVVDCGLFTDFIADEVMTLSYTASFGDACVTIESTLFFDAAGTASEWDAEGNVLSTFSYEVSDLNGQCLLTSPVASCGAQILAFNNDNSALTLTADGEEASLTPVAGDVTNQNTSVQYATIQAGIDAASAGDVLILAATTFYPTSTITVDKPLTINGAGSGSTTITTTSAGYGMSISADNVSLSGFTLDGSGTFGVKASGVSNFSLNDVEATNGGNSAIDLNGVNGATLTNISASNTALGYGLAYVL